MGILDKGNFIHWNYFLALEQDLAQVSRYIEFSKPNFKVYSIELAHLLLAASSEFDVVLKALCNLHDPNREHSNIDDYSQTVMAKAPDLVKETCEIPRFGLQLKPFSNWKKRDIQHPDWWRSYNNVKHHRDTHFRDANLKNTLNAMSALSLVVLYYYYKLATQRQGNVAMKDVTNRLKPEASLIRFHDGYYHGYLMLE